MISVQANIADKEAYPHVQASCHSRTLYGDFDAPIVEGVLLETKTPTETEPYHRLSAKLEIAEDVSRSPCYAGMQTTKAAIAISGNVREAVSIRYVISDNPKAPDALADYTETGVIPVNNVYYLASALEIYDTDCFKYSYAVQQHTGI